MRHHKASLVLSLLHWVVSPVSTPLIVVRRRGQGHSLPLQDPHHQFGETGELRDSDSRISVQRNDCSDRMLSNCCIGSSPRPMGSSLSHHLRTNVLKCWI